MNEKTTSDSELIAMSMLEMDHDRDACNIEVEDDQSRDENGNTPFMRVAKRLGFDYEVVGEACVDRVSHQLRSMMIKSLQEGHFGMEVNLPDLAQSYWIEGFLVGVSYQQRKDSVETQ